MGFVKTMVLAVCLSLSVMGVAEARGGFSGGGRSFGGGGGFRSSGSYSSGRSSGFSSGRSYSSPSRSTTTITRSYSTRSYGGGYGGHYSYGGAYVHPMYGYGGFGMGYMYNNGLLTGMIIGNMMHPQGTMMYNGPGQYQNNALMYPDGRVVDQSGRVVGTYVNGAFTPMDNGPMVGQPVPTDAGQQQQQQATPVVINTGPTAEDIGGYIILGILCFFFFFLMIGIML